MAFSVADNVGPPWGISPITTARFTMSALLATTLQFTVQSLPAAGDGPLWQLIHLELRRVLTAENFVPGLPEIMFTVCEFSHPPASFTNTV